MSKKNAIPETAITISTYAELEQYAKQFAGNGYNLLGVVGTGGLSKTQTFTRAMGQKPHLYVKGHCTAYILYQELYTKQNQPALIDDADTLYGTSATRPLLKALCETTTNKLVMWGSKSLPEEFPRSFSTTSKTCILANDFSSFTKSRDGDAITDRGIWLNFLPTVHEVHKQVGTWFKDKEVYEHVGKHLRLVRTPSMRYYTKALELKKAPQDNWREIVLAMMNSAQDRKALELVSTLMEDDRTEDEKIDIFERETGKSRATYFRYKKELKERGAF